MDNRDIFQTRLDSLMKRRTLQDLKEFSFEGTLLESVSKSKEPLIIKYINQAAEEVDKRYTEISYEDGERVKTHLYNGVDDVSFEYQGSVSNNTHIKASSDLDLLVISENELKYTENDMVDLKDSCEDIIKERFPKVSVERGAKSIKLEGGSLRRKIDVVPSHWDLENRYYRGVAIYDEDKKKIMNNTPFYHNSLLELKDDAAKGFYKKAVRLIKNIKFSLEEESNTFILSSYEIVALIYLIDFTKYNIKENTDLILILIKELNLILQRKDLKELLVPDGSRKIVRDPKIVVDIRKIIDELLVINKKLEATKNPAVQYQKITSAPKSWGS